MMTKLKNEVTKLVDFELEMANKEHGERFNSAHEAYAVMKEEYEEAKEALIDVSTLLNDHSCPPNYGAEQCLAVKMKYNQPTCEKCWLDYLNQEVGE